MISPLILSYAEIHYHLRFLYPAYFKKQPEIIADCPRRSITSNLPVLIIIKDSHRFPVSLKSIYVKISDSEKERIFKFDKEIDLSQQYWSNIVNVDISEFTKDQWLNLDVVMDVVCAGKELKILNDNYTLTPKSFSVFYTQDGLPYPTGWYPGDPHVHTYFTSDQVEFGADISSTAIMAKAMGLRWFFPTDHSYDLDDKLDDYLTNDPALPKWKQLWKETNELSSEALRIIPGEEISIGNSDKRNVHLLAINHPTFVTGSGDSAERWFRNKPEHNISEVPSWQTDKNLFIAAHPAEKPPLAQALTLRRGAWSDDDFSIANIGYLQLINSATTSYLNKAISMWKRLLLKKKRLLIIAGNDAHGNFNSMRQIKRPFLTLFRSQSQTFGNYHTIFHLDRNDPVAGIKKGEIMVSNGIFLAFNVVGNSKKYTINDVCCEKDVTINWEAKITREFGDFAFLDLLIGDYHTGTEKTIKMKQSIQKISLPEKGYLRLHLVSTEGGNLFTNPIWIDR